MKWIDDANLTWHRWWSNRFAIASAVMAVCAVISTILPLWSPLLDARLFAMLSALCSTVAVLARQVRQDKVPEKVAEIKEQR